MRIPRALVWFFVVMLAALPILNGCQRRPAPSVRPQVETTVTAATVVPVPASPTARQTAAPVVAQAAPTAAPAPSPMPTMAPLPPLIVDVTPAPGEEYDVRAPIKITFDQPMDPASTESAFKIEPAVTGKVSVQGPQLTFTPGQPLDRASMYHVQLGSDATSAHGLKLQQPISFTVGTVGYLEVTGNQPADKAREVAVDTKIVVSFNRPVVPLTGVNEQATLPQPLVITPTVEGKGEWLSTSIYQFTPQRGLAAATDYSVTVKAGLEGTTGALLAAGHSFGFSTDHPRVNGWLPENVLDMRVEKPISVTFSMPMDRTSTEKAFSLTDLQGNRIEGAFTWNADTTQLGFRPAHNLNFETTYRALVGAEARAAGGQALLETPGSQSYRTVALPRVTRSEPANGNQNADPYGGIMFQLAGPIDPATLISGTVTILPRPTQVYTNYNEYDHQFYVNFTKLPVTPYTITLSGSIGDSYGNTMGQDFVLRFRTGDFGPSLELNAPGPIGTYNAYTTTEASVFYQNVGPLTFNLYRVPAADFLRLTGRNYYDAQSSYRASPNDLVRRWSVEGKAATNVRGLSRTRLTTADGAQLPAGLYYLRVTAPSAVRTGPAELSQQQWLARTDLNVTLKSTEDAALAWVTDLKTGQPMPGTKVQFVDGDKVNMSAVTDGDGIAQVTFPTRAQPWDPMMALATGAGGQLGVASSAWDNGITAWNFNLGSGVSAAAYMGYVYTDRPIYRPGQDVYWKAIIRRDRDAQYSLPPAGLPVTVTINDDQGNKLLEQSLPLSALGTVDGKLPLGAEAAIGYYNIQVQISKDIGFGIGFQVAEYRKPEYQITAGTDKPEYIQGEQIRAGVQASYYFGGPVKNGKVHWALMSSDYTFAYKAPRETAGANFYTFGDWDWFDWENRQGFGSPISQGNGVTDAAGYFTVTLPADIAKFLQSQRFVVDFTVTDANNQAVSTQASAIVHKASFYLGLHPQSYVATAEQQNAIDVLAVDTQSRPVANTNLTVVANRITWFSVREQSDDGQYYLVSKPKKTPFFTQTLTTGADGTAVFRWQPDGAGEYKIEANGRDQAGHAVRGAAFVWVSSGEYAYWRQENNDRIQLVADRDEYRPGDTARLLAASPYQGKPWALVTLERNHVLSHEVIQLQGNSEVLQVPVRAEHAPNVFVSIMIVNGMDGQNSPPSFKMGLTQLKVSVADRQLQVIARPDRPQVGPREDVTWNVETRDSAGRPVPDAEVSLALVDKAILSLADDQAGTLMNRFYSQRSLGIRTASTLVVNVDRLVAELNRGAAKGGGGGGAAEVLAVRREFPDVAFWNAAVTTGTDGKAQVKLTLPDNLTTWTMDARAVTGDTLVGQSKTDLLATKDLLVRPVLPRFFVQGDQAQIGAIVHNNTTTALDVTLDMQATGLQVDSATTSGKVTIAPQSTYQAAWNVTVQSGPGAQGLLEQARVLMRAAGGNLQDAVETTLPVYRYTTPEVTGTSGQVPLSASGTTVQQMELVRLPAGADPARGRLDVVLEPSLAAGMQGGLTYLEHYPYECVEQTVSRFLPNVVTYQALKSLGIDRPDLQERLPEEVAVGLQRLYNQQHLDGGWGWWPQDQSKPFITSYVIFGIARAQRAGFSVDGQVLKRATSYLQRNLKAPKGLNPNELNEQTFMVHALALAGDPQPNRAGALFEERNRLSTYAKGYLALALAAINDEAGADRIKTLVADLTGSAAVSATTAHWEEGWVDYWNMNTDTRTTSIVLDVLSTLDPKNALGPNVVRWLMLARKADRWQTTQENAWAIMALTDWMASTGELEGDYSWTVTVNDREMGKGTVTPRAVGNVTELRASVGDLLTGQTNSLVFERHAEGDQTGKGQLYYTARLQSYMPVTQIQPQSRGVTVSRQYQPAECGQAAAPLPAAKAQPRENTCPATTTARVGDVLNVKVTVVVPAVVHYLTVEDPLPAGLEAIDTSLKTTSQTAQGPQLQKGTPAPGQAKPVVSPYWWWTPTRIDLRDEKAVLFATSLPAGTYEFNYQARATLPGKFLTLPVTAYAMYYPEVQGHGAGSVFTVTAQ